MSNLAKIIVPIRRTFLARLTEWAQLRGLSPEACAGEFIEGELAEFDVKKIPTVLPLVDRVERPRRNLPEEKLLAAYDKGTDVRAIASNYGVSYSTVHRIIRKHRTIKRQKVWTLEKTKG